MRSTLLAVITGIGAALVLPAGAAVGVPDAVGCGDTVMVDTVLTEDLVCPDGNGLVLGAGVVLDLGGHSLIGPGGAGQAITFDGAAPATLVDGTIRGWLVGVSSGETFVAHTVRSVTFVENGTALESFLTGGYQVERAVFERNEADIAVFRSPGGLSVSRSTFTDGGGVGVVGTSAVIATSTFVGSGVSCSDGILEVQRSSFRGADQAVAQGDCSGSVAKSRFLENRSAFSVASSNSSEPVPVTDSVFRGNEDAVVATGAGAALRGNLFVDNDRAVFAPAPPDDDPFWSVDLERNVLIRNDDAIYTEVPGSVGHNVAIKNTGYGIYAPRATDLGGNIAVHNGVEPQCTGVVCRPR